MAKLKDRGGRIGNRIHRTLFRWSKGRVGGRLMGMTVVELITIGRRSGEPRSTMLTAPLYGDEQVVLVASWGGDDRHPLWYLNLRDHPDVEVRARGEHRLMRARTASPDEKAEMWPRLVDVYKGYDGYQRRTERDIPVVILEPH